MPGVKQPQQAEIRQDGDAYTINVLANGGAEDNGVFKSTRPVTEFHERRVSAPGQYIHHRHNPSQDQKPDLEIL